MKPKPIPSPLTPDEIRKIVDKSLRPVIEEVYNGFLLEGKVYASLREATAITGNYYTFVPYPRA